MSSPFSLFKCEHCSLITNCFILLYYVVVYAPSGPEETPGPMSSPWNTVGSEKVCYI